MKEFQSMVEGLLKIDAAALPILNNLPHHPLWAFFQTVKPNDGYTKEDIELLAKLLHQYHQEKRRRQQDLQDKLLSLLDDITDTELYDED